MQEAKFVPYYGYLMGLEADENHLVFRWKGEGKVLFSVTQLGEAASCHVASDKKGLKGLRQACLDFENFIYSHCDWCTMIIVCITVKSVGKMVQKIGFKPFATAGEAILYMKVKNG